MIILNGPTGSGKSTILNQLKTEGCYVIPTYTTRPRRDTDGEDTICVTPHEFLEMLAKGEFLTTFTAHTVHGDWYYGIALHPIINMHKIAGFNSVLVSNYFFTPALKQCLLYTEPWDFSFTVFLDVDYDTIAKNKRTDNITDKDTIDRLHRDDWKMQELKEHSDLVVMNHNFEKSPELITHQITTKYYDAIRNKGGHE